MKTRPTDALARPALPAAPTPTPAALKRTRRLTLDLDSDDHRALRLWAVETELDAPLLLRALLGIARRDPATRARAEGDARELLADRRGGDR